MVLHLLKNHEMNDTKFVSAQQAQTIFNYKNTKTNEAIWFHKIPKIYHVILSIYTPKSLTHFTYCMCICRYNNQL